MLRFGYELRTQNIVIKEKTVNLIAKYFDDMHKDFQKGVVLVHRKSVFQILTRLIRICPVDSGRLRGSWTPFLDKYGNGNYQKFLQARPLLTGSRKTAGKGFDQTAYKDGKSMGFYIDELLSTLIGTNVKYAEYVEAKLNFLAQTVVWGEKRYNDNMTNFLDQAVKKEMIPEVNANDEGAQN